MLAHKPRGVCVKPHHAKCRVGLKLLFIKAARSVSLLLPQFSDEKSKAHRKETTCPRWQIQSQVAPACKIRHRHEKSPLLCAPGGKSVTCHTDLGERTRKPADSCSPGA